MDFKDAFRRYGRFAAVLTVLGVFWLVGAMPRPGGGGSPVTLGGPRLGPDSARASTPGSPGGLVAKPKVRHYVVHVAGAVKRPGVYKVLAPGRLINAVRRAGGLTADADLTQVNLAARLTDGRQIVVPRLAGGVGAGGAMAGAAGGGGPGAASGATSSGGASGLAPGTKLSINSATPEQLDTLDGVGPAMAAAIIELRTKLGGFTKLEQLDDVPGVGEKRLASLRQQVEL